MMIEDVLRPAVPTDLPHVYLGELDYIRQIEPENEAGWQRGMRFHLEQWTSNLARMFVLERDGAFAGYGFWQIEGEAAVLASIGVVPALRGKGLGRRLLEYFIADARARGHASLLLGVHHANPARHLYENAGFVFTHAAQPYLHYRYAK